MDAEKRKIFIGFLAVAGFIATITIYFFVNLFQQFKKYRQLQKEKLNAEIAASDAERKVIATELHNDIAPFLSSVIMRLEGIQTTQKNQIEDCKQAVEYCVEKIRKMTRQLYPISLHELPFQVAIKQFIKDFNIAGQMSIDIVEVDKVDLPPEYHHQIYIMLQEIISNSVKHSQGTKLLIEITQKNHNLILKTKDDGIGFDIHEVLKKEKITFGLLNIQNRVGFLKGDVEVSHQKNRGTKYIISLPLPS